MKPRDFLGKGMEATPGKPFGYAHVMERQAIREHLQARGLAGAELEFRVVRIQERLHRSKPTFRDRQAAWLARQPKSLPAVRFTEEELARIAEHFQGANDPVAQAIHMKAVRA